MLSLCLAECLHKAKSGDFGTADNAGVLHQRGSSTRMSEISRELSLAFPVMSWAGALKGTWVRRKT